MQIYNWKIEIFFFFIGYIFRHPSLTRMGRALPVTHREERLRKKEGGPFSG